MLLFFIVTTRRNIDAIFCTEAVRHGGAVLRDLRHALIAYARFRDCDQGSFADDLDAVAGLAKAEFVRGNAAAAIVALTSLFTHCSARPTGGATLIVVRVLAIAEAENAEAASHHPVLTVDGPEP